MKKLLAAFLLILSLAPPTAYAVDPDEMLTDPALEQRARNITRELRCVVCQNQSVDDSDAPLAKDIRVLVRERISSGETDEQVVAFIVERYGKFVLLNPPLALDTALLWVGPFALFALAIGIAATYIRRTKVEIPPPLTEEEERRVKQRIDEPSP